MLQMHYFAGSRPWSFNELTALKEKYREVFGEETRSSRKQYLFRRIAWQLQGYRVLNRETHVLLDELAD